MNDLLVILLIATIFTIGLFYEEIKLFCQTVYNVIALMIECYIEYQKTLNLMIECYIEYQKTLNLMNVFGLTKPELERVQKILYTVGCLGIDLSTDVEVEQLKYTSPCDLEWDNLLEGVTDTESIAEYQEGCTIQKLVPEVSDWKQEMIDDLSFYCPMVIIGRIINRIEEIIDNKN